MAQTYDICRNELIDQIRESALECGLAGFAGPAVDLASDVP